MVDDDSNDDELTHDELMELYWEKYPERGAPDAQQLHDFNMELNPPDFSKMASKEEIEAMMVENAISLYQTGIVEAVMEKHGLTEEEAERIIESYGG